MGNWNDEILRLTKMAARKDIYVSSSVENAEAATEITLALGATNASRLVYLQHMHLVRTDGIAATWAPRLGTAAGFTDDDINDELAVASAAVGTPINQVYATGDGLPMYTDASGNLYLHLGFNAGSDNDANYHFVFARFDDR
jgi:hypothetical protein